MTFLEAEGAGTSDVTVPGTNGEVWDTVKFSFEIEEVSAAVFLKETAKVGVVHTLHMEEIMFEVGARVAQW